MENRDEPKIIRMEEWTMRTFLNSDAFVILWGAALLVYWPAGVALSIIGLLGGDRKRCASANF